MILDHILELGKQRDVCLHKLQMHVEMCPDLRMCTGPSRTMREAGAVADTILTSLPLRPQNEEVHDEAEESEDDFEEMNLSLLSARSFPRKASQTSIFLQEWDIPFEQLEIGELIGKGRFGQVYHGRWHGEVAIRLIDIERDNEDQLKAFKREVMAYRQTRHENVVLFMGACMSPPHLAIITRSVPPGLLPRDWQNSASGMVEKWFSAYLTTLVNRPSLVLPCTVYLHGLRFKIPENTLFICFFRDRVSVCCPGLNAVV